MTLTRALLSLLTVATLLATGCNRQGPDQPATPGTNPPAATAATNATAAVDPANATMARLVGKWERGDGGYMLDIKAVDAAGKLDAGYFNPSPIHVSKALALKENAGLKVFIELQDTGYPGCTYSLQYDPATDQLFGQYFQAAQQQTYDVAFGRIKE